MFAGDSEDRGTRCDGFARDPDHDFGTLEFEPQSWRPGLERFIVDPGEPVDGSASP